MLLLRAERSNRVVTGRLDPRARAHHASLLVALPVFLPSPYQELLVAEKTQVALAKP